VESPSPVAPVALSELSPEESSPVEVSAPVVGPVSLSVRPEPSESAEHANGAAKERQAKKGRRQRGVIAG
jgi:hypothetical protein